MGKVQQAKYAIVWEDPRMPDDPVRITYPDPNWLKSQIENGLTEEQATELLVMKDLPLEVWHPKVPRNRQLFYIIPREEVPRDRYFRDAWRLNDEEAINV